MITIGNQFIFCLAKQFTPQAIHEIVDFNSLRKVDAVYFFIKITYKNTLFSLA